MNCPYTHREPWTPDCSGIAPPPKLVKIRSAAGKVIAMQCPTCHRVWIENYGARGRELKRQTAPEQRKDLMEAYQ